MPDQEGSPPHGDSHPTIRGAYRSPALRGEPQRISRIPTMRGSLVGLSGRFVQRYQADYTWNQSLDSRAEAPRARCPGELASDTFDGKDPYRHAHIFVKAPCWKHRLVCDEVECFRFATDQLLPGDLPLSAIKRLGWRMYPALSLVSLRLEWEHERTRS